MIDRRLMLSALAGLGLVASAAQAVVVDTFTRPDGAVLNNSIGTTETGTYIYTYGERGDSPLTAGQNPSQGTAELTGTQLRITGYSPTASRSPGAAAITSNPGGVYLTNYSAANTTVGADVSFRFNAAAPSNTSTDTNYFLTSYFEILVRTQAAQTLGNSASDNGLLDIAIGPNGDQLVREVVNGTLSGGLPVASGFFANPFTQSNTVGRRPLTGGGLARIKSFPIDGDPSHNIVIDANGNGFVDGTEFFNYTAEVNGNTVKTYLDGVQVGQWTTTYTSGANGNFVGLSKNRRAAADTFVGDVYLDNFTLEPLTAPTPEPATLATVSAAGLMVVCRRRQA